MPAIKTSKHNEISNQTLSERTGRTWPQWFEVLDAADATAMTHAELARFLHERQKLSEWWCQMIVVGYERARGIRDKNQKCTGERSVSVSRTIAVPVETVYAICADDNARAAWLEPKRLVIRKANENRNLRLTWPDGTDVELRFAAKAAGKCQVVADHGKLANADEVEKMRAFWSAALERLRLVSESPV